MELLGQRKINLVSEDRPGPHSWIKMYILNFKKATKKQDYKKQKETKEEKRISVENLTGYDDIVWEFALCTFHLLDRVVNFSWLFIWFNVVYVQWEKSQCLLYYNNIWITHFQEQKYKKSLRDIVVYHLLIYICLFRAANLLQ